MYPKTKEALAGLLQGLRLCNGADDGIRTRDPNLGKVMLYQLSHVRATAIYYTDSKNPRNPLFEKLLGALHLEIVGDAVPHYPADYGKRFVLPSS